jgi:sn-glycerol 3-phosphate transport system permease protein
MSVPTRRSTWRRQGIGPWLIVPALLLLALFVFRPLARTAELSAYASDLIGNPTRFIGIDNYVALLQDPNFLHTVFVSIVIALLSMVLATTGALLAALLLRTRLPAAGLFNVIFSLPFAFSAAAASAIFAGLFAPSVGVLNFILSGIGIAGPNWFGDPVAAVWAVSIATAWYEFGFAFLVLTAAVRGVPPEIIEAAQIDGAGARKLALGIIIPMMRPSILFLVVTQTISGLQTFAQIQVLTRGGPADATTNLVFRLYQLAFGNGTPDFGRASVVAMVLMALVVGITALQFRLFRTEKEA